MRVECVWAVMAVIEGARASRGGAPYCSGGGALLDLSRGWRGRPSPLGGPAVMLCGLTRRLLRRYRIVPYIDESTQQEVG